VFQFLSVFVVLVDQASNKGEHFSFIQPTLDYFEFLPPNLCHFAIVAFHRVHIPSQLDLVCDSSDVCEKSLPPVALMSGSTTVDEEKPLVKEKYLTNIHFSYRFSK
jgi:hypothetical protein